MKIDKAEGQNWKRKDSIELSSHCETRNNNLTCARQQAKVQVDEQNFCESSTALKGKVATAYLPCCCWIKVQRDHNREQITFLSG